MFLCKGKMRIITVNRCTEVIFFYLAVIVYGVICDKQQPSSSSTSLSTSHQRWHNNDAEYWASGHLLRHRHQSPLSAHSPSSTHTDEQLVPIIRHHNHQLQRYHHLRHTTTTTTPQPTTIAPTTSKPPPAEHHLRHSNKLYQPWEIDSFRQKSNYRRRINASHHGTTTSPIGARTAWDRSGLKSLPSKRTNAYNNRPAGNNPAPVYNVSTVMKNRYFDRDGLYRSNTHTSGVRRTIPTIPIGTRIRHPYDILRVAHKDRVHTETEVAPPPIIPAKNRFDDIDTSSDSRDAEEDLWRKNLEMEKKTSAVALKSIGKNRKKEKELEDDDYNYDDEEDEYKQQKVVGR